VDVVVLFFSHQQKLSQEFILIYQKVTRKVYALAGDRIMMGKIDLAKNDVEEVIDHYPQVRLYRKDKRDEPFIFKTQMKADMLLDFIELYSPDYQKALMDAKKQEF